MKSSVPDPLAMLQRGVALSAQSEIRSLRLTDLSSLHMLLAKTRQDLLAQQRPIDLDARSPEQLVGLLAASDKPMGPQGIALGIFHRADRYGEAKLVAAGLLLTMTTALSERLHQLRLIAGPLQEWATLCGGVVADSHRSRGLGRQILPWRLLVATVLGLAVVTEVAARNHHSVSLLGKAGLYLIHAERDKEHPSEWVFCFASVPRLGSEFQAAEQVGFDEEGATLTTTAVAYLRLGCIGRMTNLGTWAFYRRS